MGRLWIAVGMVAVWGGSAAAFTIGETNAAMGTHQAVSGSSASNGAAARKRVTDGLKRAGSGHGSALGANKAGGPSGFDGRGTAEGGFGTGGKGGGGKGGGGKVTAQGGQGWSGGAKSGGGSWASAASTSGKGGSAAGWAQAGAYGGSKH